jgi:DNA-binding CsgD family transcriptional regulator
MLRRLGAITAVPGGGHAPLSLTASPMTTAQLRVLDYLPTHLNYTEIAVELFISRNTVKSHAIAIFRKLGVSSRSEAIVVAGRLGLAPHGDFVFLSTAEQSILLDLLAGARSGRPRSATASPADIDSIARKLATLGGELDVTAESG